MSEEQRCANFWNGLAEHVAGLSDEEIVDDMLDAQRAVEEAEQLRALMLRTVFADRSARFFSSVK